LGYLLSAEGLDGTQIIIRTSLMVWITTCVLAVLAYVNKQHSNDVDDINSTDQQPTVDNAN